MAEPMNVEWDWIDLSIGDKWSESRRKLIEAEAPIDDLSRSVYVIRIAERYAIKYPDGPSPTIYIGRGNLPGRRAAHMKWLSRLKNEFPDLTFELGVNKLRVRNNPMAYKDLEAALLLSFSDKFGSLPLKNRRSEKRQSNYPFRQRDLGIGINPGSGGHYLWSIVPMRRSSFYKDYLKKG